MQRAHLPRRTYLLPLAAMLCTWAAQEWASGADWYADVPFGTIFGISVAFLAGLVVQDFYDPESWIRRLHSDWTRVFQIEWASFPHDATPSIEWLHLKVQVRYVKTIKVSISVRVFYPLGRANEQTFVLHGDWEGPASLRAKDTLQGLTLATFPLRAYDGDPPGYDCWGAQLRRSGDDQGMRSLSDGTNTLIEINARTWRGAQTERVLLVWPEQRAGGYGRTAITENAAVALSTPNG
jgi:hypothetical protein